MLCVGHILCAWGKEDIKITCAENMMDVFQWSEITELKTHGLVKPLLLDSLITQEAASIVM